jgi:hypothetical protein
VASSPASKRAAESPIPNAPSIRCGIRNDNRHQRAGGVPRHMVPQNWIETAEILLELPSSLDHPRPDHAVGALPRFSVAFLAAPRFFG